MSTSNLMQLICMWHPLSAIRHDITFEEGDPGENPWVNGRPKREEIEVERYDPMWVEQYEILEAEIKASIPEVALSVQHVGSTAVPGLLAKPVIDLIVPDPELEDDYVPVLEALGYELTIRERSWYQHRMLRHENPREFARFRSRVRRAYPTHSVSRLAARASSRQATLRRCKDAGEGWSVKRTRV